MIDTTTEASWPPKADSGAIRIAAVESEFEWRNAKALILDYIEWARAALRMDDPYTAQPDIRGELADLRVYYSPPRGRMMLAWLDEMAVGVVGVVTHRDGAGEMKRLYVRPAGRGIRLGERLVETCLEEAAVLGCHTLKLETVAGLMDTAIALYRRLGFVEAAAFGGTAIEGMVYLERPISPIPPRAA